MRRHRRPATGGRRAGVFMLATCCVRSGRLSMNQSSRRLKAGRRSSVSASSVSTAKSGIRPTIERIFSGCRGRSAVEHVVEEAVVLVPQPAAVVADRVASRGRYRGSVPRTCSRRPRTPDCRPASSIAIASMLRQYIAIQLVPSDCSRWPPVGSGSTAIEDADVVEPEEAALEDVVAFRVLAVDPPREVEQQLLEHPLEEDADRPCPVRRFSIL